MGSVSPELALVDPTLRALVQAELPLPPDCLAPRPQAPEAVRTATRARVVRGWSSSLVGRCRCVALACCDHRITVRGDGRIQCISGSNLRC